LIIYFIKGYIDLKKGDIFVMKIGYLIRYSVVLVALILVLFLILSILSYNFSYNTILSYSYKFIAPICLFIVSFLYAMKVKERGILRGLEIWAVYFLLLCIIKYTVFQALANAQEINILKHLIYIPISIVAGILGVNAGK
jgi:putative membrane protein (TIGR04086 family)